MEKSEVYHRADVPKWTRIQAIEVIKELTGEEPLGKRDPIWLLTLINQHKTYKDQDR